MLDDRRPLALLQRLRPDLCTKGGEYAVSDLKSAQEIESYGGRTAAATDIESGRLAGCPTIGIAGSQPSRWDQGGHRVDTSLEAAEWIAPQETSCPKKRPQNA